MFESNTSILVVDDMAAMRMRISNQLKSLGFENIIQASNGLEAWDAIIECYHSGTPIELVVSDWNMPEMNGLDFLKKIRSTKEVHTLPFLMVTAEGEKEQVILAIQSGVTDYVIKPVGKDDLLRKLQNVWTKVGKAA